MGPLNTDPHTSIINLLGPARDSYFYSARKVPFELQFTPPILATFVAGGQGCTTLISFRCRLPDTSGWHTTKTAQCR